VSDPFCVLLSFHYMGGFDLTQLLDKTFGTERDDVIVFMDSGAYSAMTQGAPIDLDDYGKFLDRFRHELHLMANLDDIGHTAETAETGWRNWCTLRERYDLPIMPVMHIGEPFEVLERYLDAGETYIALGGLTTTPWRVGAPWLVKAFQRATGRAVFHGFGVSSWESQRHLPWYTVDHRGWLAGAEFARLTLFNGRRRRSFELTHVDPTSRTSEFNTLARSYGVDPKTARIAGVKATPPILTLSARSVVRQDHFMRRRHGVINHPSGDTARWPPGLRTFFVDNNLGHLTVARNALKGWTP
jgi:hypothetical protein